MLRQTRETMVVIHAAEVLDLVRPGAGKPYPGLLDSIVGLGREPSIR